MSEYELLKGVYLVLKGHEVRNGLVTNYSVSGRPHIESAEGDLPFVGIVDTFEANILLVFKETCNRNQPMCGDFSLRLSVPLNSGCCLWNASFARRK